MFNKRFTKNQLKLLRQWAKALRSGKYTQTQETLCRVGDDKTRSFCCLGVLCDMVDTKRWKEDPFVENLSWSGLTGLPPHSTLKRFGLSGAEAGQFVNLNDDHSATFEEIAEVIDWIVLSGDRYTLSMGRLGNDD